MRAQGSLIGPIQGGVTCFTFNDCTTITPCTIRSEGLCTIQCDLVYQQVSFLYDINLGATTTTILSIRGVTIPIDLVSSATDSIR